MDLRHLRYFLAVAETRNFTQAAANCYVAQSALSQQIARLEKDVGAQLFSRTSRSVRLTAAGELLEPLARRIFADVDNAQAALDALSGLRRGRLRLGLVQTRASLVDLVEVMADYHARHPGIDFHVTNAPSSEMAAAVLAGDLDIAVVGLAPRQLPDGLDHTVLADDPLILIVPPTTPWRAARWPISPTSRTATSSSSSPRAPGCAARSSPPSPAPEWSPASTSRSARSTT